MVRGCFIMESGVLCLAFCRSLRLPRPAQSKTNDHAMRADMR